MNVFFLHSVVVFISSWKENMKRRRPDSKQIQLRCYICLSSVSKTNLTVIRRRKMGIWFELRDGYLVWIQRAARVFQIEIQLRVLWKSVEDWLKSILHAAGAAARPRATSGMLCCSLWNATEFGASSQAQVMVGYDRVQKNFKIDRILWICLIFRALFQCILDRAAARSASESRGCSGANGARPRCPSTSAGYALHSLSWTVFLIFWTSQHLKKHRESLLQFLCREEHGTDHYPGRTDSIEY